MSRVFKNFTILKEQPREEDSLGYSQEISYVRQRIDQVALSGDSSIIAYIGPFGSGKSTILRNVKSKIGKQYKWIDFDTWRYSNRNELWDAFVVKASADLTMGKDEWDVADEVDGNELDAKRTVLLWVWIFVVWLILTVFSVILWTSFKGEAGFWEAYLKFATPVIAPILLLVGLGRILKISHLSDKRPLRRTFELEELLYRKISTSLKPIVIIIEDVDRAGEDGAVFMETLHEFIGAKKFKKPIIIIAPQSNDGFEVSTTDRQKLEHSLKVYDEKIFFGPKMEHSSIDSLYSGLEFHSGYEVYKPAMIEITKELVYYYQAGQLTIRMLKHALREVEWFMQTHPDHNPAVALVFSITRMVMDPGGHSIAVNRLQAAVSPVPHKTTEGDEKRIIDKNNVLGVCLAMAVGAGGQAKALGLVDVQGKYNQHNEVLFIESKFNEKKDELVSDPDRGGGLIARVLAGY